VIRGDGDPDAMGTNTQSDADSPDTDARIDANLLAEDQPNDTASTTISALAGSETNHHEQPRFFAVGSDRTGADLDGFVSVLTTIAQSQCERATDYTDVETLVCRLPIDHLTFATHDSLAPYSGPYSMALLVRAFLIAEINGWDETALHDHLRANLSLQCDLGFETLPDQSTFWRAWNHRFSEDLRDAVRECADSIIAAARACDVSLPDRVSISEANESQADE
jgi:putative transposase